MDVTYVYIRRSRCCTWSRSSMTTAGFAVAAELCRDQRTETVIGSPREQPDHGALHRPSKDRLQGDCGAPASAVRRERRSRSWRRASSIRRSRGRSPAGGATARPRRPRSPGSPSREERVRRGVLRRGRPSTLITTLPQDATSATLREHPLDRRRLLQFFRTLECECYGSEFVACSTDARTHSSAASATGTARRRRSQPDPCAQLSVPRRGCSACLAACDSDTSGSLNVRDAILVLNYLFLGGPAPAGWVDRDGDDGEDPRASRRGRRRACTRARPAAGSSRRDPRGPCDPGLSRPDASLTAATRPRWDGDVCAPATEAASVDGLRRFRPREHRRNGPWVGRETKSAAAGRVVVSSSEARRCGLRHGRSLRALVPAPARGDIVPRTTPTGRGVDRVPRRDGQGPSLLARRKDAGRSRPCS